jgi:hypothetical protein
VATLAVTALLLGGCSVQPGSFRGYENPAVLPTPAPPPDFGLLTGPGVTDEPCTSPVDPTRGCIHLGAVVATSGPFTERDQAALDGARAFWDRVNRDGGITVPRVAAPTARFEVEVGPVGDTTGHPDSVLRAFEAVEPDALALALSSGTSSSDRILAAYQHAGTAAVPLDGWSGWAFEPSIVETGTDTCFQAVDGMDWAASNLPHGGPMNHVVVVHYPDRYGHDALAGVEYWVHPTGRDQRHDRIPFDASHHVVTVTPGGDVQVAVDRILTVAPDVVVVATGPDELAAIASRTAAAGWSGLIVGMAPTFAPRLLDDPAVADVLTSRYVRTASVGPVSGTATAYADMRDASGGTADEGWVLGWLSQYPIRRALEKAIESGDLTRAGLRAAIGRITVDYDGALPPARYHGDPSADVLRRTWIERPDPEVPGGQRVLAGAYVGASAIRKPFTRACTER